MKKVKRIFFPLVLVILLAAVAVFATACGGDDKKHYSPASDFIWEIVDGKVNIIGYFGNDKEVIIPPEINGAPVTSIGGVAVFSNYFYVTSITIPDSVTSIGNSAFSGCTNLTSITIPDSVTNIGEAAFYGCTSLTSITIPEGVTSIGGYAFSHCTNLASIIVDENNPNYRSIDGNLYSKDGKILVAYAAGKQDSSFIIPEDVTSIGDSAFSGCSNLASIDIPEGVTSIGEAAFYECTNLASIDIPDVVTSIGASAFYRCTSLTSITIPDSVTNIGEAAFYGCTSLTSITIPDSVTSIGEFAFGSYDVGLTIYCEAIIEPSGWVYGWCSSNCYVFWGYKINKTT